MDLFDIANKEQFEKSKPLAERMRPTCFTDFYGQEHICGEGSLLRRAISIDRLGNCIFYGNAGCGKTSLAHIISEITMSNCIKLNAVTTGIVEAKKIMDEAYTIYKRTGKKTYLILDECHRWNKAQSDCLLAPIEQGYIIFIGTTTENPYISLTKPLLSRSRVFSFKPLSAEIIAQALTNCISDERGLKCYDIDISQTAIKHIAEYACGDLRSAYASLELAVLTTPINNKGIIVIDENVANECIEQKNYALDS